MYSIGCCIYSTVKIHGFFTSPPSLIRGLCLCYVHVAMCALRYVFFVPTWKLLCVLEIGLSSYRLYVPTSPVIPKFSKLSKVGSFKDGCRHLLSPLPTLVFVRLEIFVNHMGEM